jgi:hypothetical protein
MNHGKCTFGTSNESRTSFQGRSNITKHVRGVIIRENEQLKLEMGCVAMRYDQSTH